jgi:Phage late-transcription coactivator
MEILAINNFVDIGKKIEDIVWELDCDYLDACLVYCERQGLEVEFLGALIKKNHYIRGKLQSEAEDLNFLKRTTRLDI